MKPAIAPSQLVRSKDGSVRLRGTKLVVAEILKDVHGVYRFRTKNGAGKWREQPSRTAFKGIADCKKELCKWI